MQSSIKLNFLFAFFIFFTFSTVQGQTLCVDGFAGDYPCSNIDLMSHIPLDVFETGAGNDSWGWTDPDTGKEYAIFGCRSSAGFVDITDPVNPIYLGKLPTHSGNSVWRDIKVYNNYAFVVSEAGGHGMQVFDLTRLRDVPNPPEIFTEDAHNDSFGSAHNIAINESTGYAYIIGTNQYDGGPIFINIQDPLNPVNEGGYGADGYSHDAQIITYNGPDTDHTGQEIYIGSNETSIVFVDVTDKANPVKISEAFYSNTAYTHQAWTDESQTFLFCNDEIDETNFGFNTRNIVFNLTDLDNPSLQMEYYGETTAIDHNNYIVGNELYIANYTAGTRIIDISDVGNGNMHETAFFDSHPDNDNPNYNGVWNVYPYFESGNIVVSDINEGLFIIKKSTVATSTQDTPTHIAFITPNPAGSFLDITSDYKSINTIEVYNMQGQRTIKLNNLKATNKYILNIDNIQPGTYVIKINGETSRKFIKQ